MATVMPLRFRLAMLPAVAAVLSSPSAIATGSTTASFQVTTDTGAGTLYQVVTQSSTAPTAAQIESGLNDTGSPADVAFNQAVTVSGNQLSGATGLVTTTTYHVFSMQKVSGLYSNVVGAAFTTTSEPTGNLLLEDGTDMLLEDGTNLLLG